MSRPRSKTRKDPTGPAEAHLRWQATRGWTNLVRLQHSEGIYTPPCSQASWRDANLCQDAHWQDHHSGGGAF